MLFPRFAVCLLALGSRLSLAVEVSPPDGGACWSSTFAILQNEIGAALNPTIDLAIERKYVFCEDTVYSIAALDPASGTVPNATLGEQWPLLLFTPNVHFFCPRNCTLEMISAPTNVIFAATTQIVQNSGLVPQGLSAPPSNIENLIVDGFTIRNVDQTIYEDTNGVITFGPPGRNLLVKNCDFTSVGLAGWAIASEYYASEALLQPEAIPYQTLTIQDCSFSVSRFFRHCLVPFVLTLCIFTRIQPLTGPPSYRSPSMKLRHRQTFPPTLSLWNGFPLLETATQGILSEEDGKVCCRCKTLHL